MIVGEKKLLGSAFLDAAKIRLRARICEAEAKIELYLKNPVGVGDHPNICEEITKAAEDGAHAQDVLNFLQMHWPSD